MKLRLNRHTFTEKSTIGDLFVDDKFCCYTLEDVVRPEKIKGETAVPAGTYEVIVNQSRRFRRRLPLLVGVPGFEGIRIHSGNDAGDTEGCILPGLSQGADFVGRSRDAFKKLFPLIDDATKVEKVFIEITEEQ